MKKIIAILLIFFLTKSTFGQVYAIFDTDTTRFSEFGEELPKRITEQVWYINGQEMYYGSGRVMILPNSDKLDTILYKGFNRNEFDTIICNIAEAENYTFYYNECCGAFNIQEESTKRFIQGKIVFKLLNNDAKTYLGIMGEAGIIVNNENTDTLTSKCRSAMKPNIYNVSFKEIEICETGIDCKEEICLLEKGNNEPNWDFGFNTISEKYNLLYLPLTSKPVFFIYDALSHQLKIQ